jgi:hypothetical protein
MTTHYYSIPFDVILIIAYDSPSVWCRLTLADPILGRYSLQDTTRINAQDHFTYSINVAANNYVTFTIVYKLPNGITHRNGDKPAIIQGDKLTWVWYGQIHRDDDKPAIEDISNSHTEWYQYGKPHRDGDKPAYICDDRYEWYQYGKLHRDGDKPAYICDDHNMWYQYGKLHRDGDKPAVVMDNTCQWYQHGELHRGGLRYAIVEKIDKPL